MGNVTIIGAQWGDEGKGRVVDWLSSQADVVVRFNGGHNAGHTIVVDDATYKLSLLPSGVVQGKLGIIGNGVVIEPNALFDEIAKVEAQGLRVTPNNLRISDAAILILPSHVAIDRAREAARGERSLGTTGRGIGPAYEDKVGRRATRICDLAHPATLFAKVAEQVAHHNGLLLGLGAPTFDPSEISAGLLTAAERLLPFVEPVWDRLEQHRLAGHRILFEGSQGVMLDIDHGTYPYVTASNAVAAQAATGSGVGSRSVGTSLGICKAYTTRVGAGPFPTELHDAVGQGLGDRGREFGVNTGRRRRCGWFDAVLVRQAVKVAGLDALAITKLDILDGLPELKICVGYKLNGELIRYLPTAPENQAMVQPEYEVLEGWRGSVRGVRRWIDLPPQAAAYIRRIEELVEAPIALVSSSPSRDDLIVLWELFG
jgi:adenylosuccinate synthase